MKKEDFNLFCDNCVCRDGWTCTRYGFEFVEGLETSNRVKHQHKCDFWVAMDKKKFERTRNKHHWTTLGWIKFAFDKRLYRSREYQAAHNKVKFNLEQLIGKLMEEGFPEFFIDWAKSGFDRKERPVIKKTIQEEPWTLENISLVKSRNFSVTNPN